MGRKIPLSFINDPDLCPNCYCRGLKFIDPYNSKVIMNEKTLERNQKYFIFCPNCKYEFHICWDGDKYFPIPKDEYFNQFMSTWIKE